MTRLLVLLLLLTPAVATAQKPTREQKVHDDKKKVEGEGFWIYNDVAKGFAEAKTSGKPMLVVLRCIPCEECVKLDDDLVSQDPVIRSLLDKFVCVRVVSTNGLDLTQFQFDTDQSFAAFLLNADGTVYGRFGTRSHRTNWVGDVSLGGLAKALQGALELHADYPKTKALVADKRGKGLEFPVPEKFPALRDKYTDKLDYQGNVVRSCIHCHQIGDAQREFYRAQKKPIPEAVLFPYPHPKSLGLTLDPKERATVQQVEGGSLAEKAGLKTGDAIRTMAGQTLLSIADVQWVLHNTKPEGDELPLEVKRGGAVEKLTLVLPAGWRRAGDIAWRASSWGLRRMATGGILLEELSPEERTKLKLGDGMALLAKHVGEYGPHAAAKTAGFRKGDIVIEWDGKTDLKRDTDVLLHGLTARKAGEKIPVVVLRDGKKLTFRLPMQD